MYRREQAVFRFPLPEGVLCTPPWGGGSIGSRSNDCSVSDSGGGVEVTQENVVFGGTSAGAPPLRDHYGTSSASRETAPAADDATSSSCSHVDGNASAPTNGGAPPNSRGAPAPAISVATTASYEPLRFAEQFSCPPNRLCVSVSERSFFSDHRLGTVEIGLEQLTERR